MAGLEPATQWPRVCAAERLGEGYDFIADLRGFSRARTCAHWVAGSSPAMTIGDWATRANRETLPATRFAGTRSPMPKNIVVCCDGTSNEFDGARTNVVKLYQMLVHDPKVQATYYHPGLGTMEAAGALTAFSRWWTKLAGFAFGYGLKNDIRDIYVFLMNHYEEGDRVFLFGFSRGAYTVRAVAALLHLYGLVRKGNEPLVPYAIRMMRRINSQNAGRDPENDKSGIAKTLIVAQQFKQTFASCECRPYFVGVWDTVNSVGWVENPLRLPFTGHNPSIEIGRHALSLDERRAFFQPNLWRPKEKPQRTGPRDLLQVWFPGSHGDVGGGYPEEESGLAKVALEWMLREAQHKGLLTEPAREAHIMGAGPRYAKPDPTATVHDELKASFVWRVLQFFPKKQWQRKREGGRDVWTERRKLDLAGWRKIPRDALIHDAAYARDAAYVARLPQAAKRASTLPPLTGEQRANVEPLKASA